MKLNLSIIIKKVVITSTCVCMMTFPAFGNMSNIEILPIPEEIITTESGPDSSIAETTESGDSPIVVVGSGKSVVVEETPIEEVEEVIPEPNTKGDSFGIFKTSAYCGCSLCTSHHTLTYSGTVPVANHTIAADLDVFPIGTKLMMDDIIYTVEDMGSGVNGNHLDIYFDTHQAALNYGIKYVEVFAVN